MQSTRPNFPGTKPVRSDPTPSSRNDCSSGISFEKRQKALAAQRCQLRILSLVQPLTPTLAYEFAQLAELLNELAFSREEDKLWREEAKNDRLVEPGEITIAGIRYTLSAHQFLANGRKPRPGGKFPLRLYLCGACDLVIWPYPGKYCNDSCRSEYWSRG